jgi:hypothetical protein
VRRTLRQVSHAYLPWFQLEVSFVAPLGLVLLQCVHGEAVQLGTAVPPMPLAHTLTGRSDRPKGCDDYHRAAEGVAAWGRSVSLSGGQHAGLPNMVAWAQAVLLTHRRSVTATQAAAPRSPPTSRFHHDWSRK